MGERDSVLEIIHAPSFVVVRDEARNGYFPALEVFAVNIFYEGHFVDFKRNAEWHHIPPQVFPAESGDLFRNLKSLEVPRDWVVIEQEIRTRISPQIEIEFIDEYDESSDDEDDKSARIGFEFYGVVRIEGCKCQGGNFECKTRD